MRYKLNINENGRNMDGAWMEITRELPCRKAWIYAQASKVLSHPENGRNRCVSAQHPVNLIYLGIAVKGRVMCWRWGGLLLALPINVSRARATLNQCESFFLALLHPFGVERAVLALWDHPFWR